MPLSAGFLNAFPSLTAASSWRDFFDKALGRLWAVCRLYCFSITFLAVLLAKCLRIYTHLLSLPWLSLLLFSPTLFLQDAVFLAVAHRMSWPYRSDTMTASLALLFAIITAYVCLTLRIHVHSNQRHRHIAW